MNKKEQDIIRKIKENTSDIVIPEELAPEQVGKMLEEKGKKKKINPFRIGAAAAACFVIVIGAAVYQNSRLTDDTEKNSVKETEKISDSRTVVSAEDYDQVYSYLDSYKRELERQQTKEENMLTESAADFSTGAAAVDELGESEIAQNVEMDMADGGAADAAEQKSSDYSETNVRQEGVDEGDIVKTDGTYLYVLKDNGNEIAIVDTRGNDLKKVSTISAEDGDDIREFYLDPDKKRLVLICSGMKQNPLGEEMYRSSGFYQDRSFTEAITYNVEEPETPRESGRITQSGYYQSSRMTDGYLYLFSNDYISIEVMERKSPETYVPLVNDAVIAEKNICLPPVSKASMYTVVTAADIDNPSEITDSKAILSEGGELYVSNKNIYYYETEWSYFMSHERECTTIRRISYQDGMLEPGAQGVLDGYIHDSFSIDEYKDYLRIVVTDGDTNAVYVLNMELDTVGSIENLAKDERVYSARFMGDTGYFVTFRETDPIFSVDLTDPEKPEIIGSLKIPGFSDYLHPYGAGKLLGIGMNVDEETMITDGVKLSMFDISDPSNVKEENTFIMKNVYSTDASYDYKAVLVDVEKNMIGFAGDMGGGKRYYMFGYNEQEGFECKMEEEINGNGVQGTRGVYIEETLYVVQGNIIEAYSLKDYAKVNDIIL